VSVLITGGLGLLGPVVADELLKMLRQKVVLFDSARKEIDFSDKYDDYVSVVEGDILDLDRLLDTCRKFEVNGLVHLAAIADVDLSEKDPARACKINVNGAWNVFETCRKLDIQKIVFASSGAAYGKANGPLSEEAPYNPADVYGATKVMGEVIGLQYMKSYGINLAIDRLFFIYGPGMFLEPISPFGMVKNSVEGKPTVFERGGDQPYDLTHVRDAARGVVLTLLSDPQKSKHHIFNISGGKVVRLREIAELVKKFIPEADIRIGPGELGLQRGFPLDISRARRDLGYAPKVSLEDGIKEMIAWLRENDKRREKPTSR
jgi:nucleoside-diphosphate-sugar epimerase